MGATLDALQVLQRVQLKLNALRSKIDSKRQAVRTHQRKLTSLQAEQAAKHLAILHQQSSIKQFELEFQSKEAETTRLREALNRAKTNKEYAALLTQINTGKADNSKLEDRILEMLNSLERLRADEQDIKSRIEKEKDALLNANQSVQAFEQDSGAELEALQAQRAEAAETLPLEALNTFERVAERHEGEALAQVIQPHLRREEYSCDGCNMSLTLEQFVALQSRDKLQVCYSCGRILYLDEKAIV